MREFLIAIDSDIVDSDTVYDVLTSTMKINKQVHVRPVENGTMAALDINEAHDNKGEK